MQPDTRYARSGDLCIAYQVVGDGPLDLVFVPGFISNLDHYWDQPALAHFLNRLGSFSRLILFDKRGTGLSDRLGTCLPSKSAWTMSEPSWTPWTASEQPSLASRKVAQ
jgi:pimeloyl-ACP methyl ester carboxylesterase